MIRTGLVLAVAGILPAVAVAQVPDSAGSAARAARVLAPYAAAARTAPGCAVGIAHNGRTVFEGAHGLADIEFGIPNTPQTIFESGSVAKQFTAASIVLLALEGKLGLDEPARKYIPELPDYGAPLTIRHLLNHTSGVRDWGSVLELTGFGRGDRVISQQLALDVITHQRATDFTPGAEYSYSNSGYTLLSTIVERVSHQRLPAFTAERFFAPLGMTHTGWRYDFTRLVPGRAQAYAPSLVASGAGVAAAPGGGVGAGAGGWRLSMPFMNVYGNGGMLTTVGDWLKWNAMLESRSMGGALVDSLERTGRLNDGRDITYALGLTVNSYRGKRQVAHSGSTAGYNTYLTRFPELRLSIAVLCNGASSNPTQIALRLVDEIAAPLASPVAPDTVAAATGDLQRLAAFWRDVNTHLPAQTVVENGQLRVSGGAVLRKLRDGSFLAGQGPVRWRFDTTAAGTVERATRIAGDGIERFVIAAPWSPTPDVLAQFTGEWRSDEAGAAFSAVLEKGQLVLTQRPDSRLVLRPLYDGHFAPITGGGVVIWFARDARTRALTMHFGASRMRDMPFTRVQAGQRR